MGLHSILIAFVVLLIYKVALVKVLLNVCKQHTGNLPVKHYQFLIFLCG